MMSHWTACCESTSYWFILEGGVIAADLLWRVNPTNKPTRIRIKTINITAVKHAETLKIMTLVPVSAKMYENQR